MDCDTANASPQDLDGSRQPNGPDVEDCPRIRFNHHSAKRGSRLWALAGTGYHGLVFLLTSACLLVGDDYYDGDKTRVVVVPTVRWQTLPS